MESSSCSDHSEWILLMNRNKKRRFFLCDGLFLQRARSLSRDSNNSDHSIASSIQDGSPKVTAADVAAAAGRSDVVARAEANASVLSKIARSSVTSQNVSPNDTRPRFGSLSSNASDVSTSSQQSKKRSSFRGKYHTQRVAPLTRQRSSSSSTLMAAFNPTSTMKRGLFGKELKKKNSFSASCSAMSTQSDSQYLHAIAAADAASRMPTFLAVANGQKKGSRKKLQNTLKRMSRRASGHAASNTINVGEIKLKSTKGAGTLEKDVYVTLDRHHLSYGLSHFRILKEGSFKKRGNRKVATSWKRRYFCIVPPGVLFYFDSLAHLDRFKKFQINASTYRDPVQIMTLLTCFLSSVPFYDSSLSQLTVLNQYKGERHVLLVRVGNKSDAGSGAADSQRGKNLSVSSSGAKNTALKDDLRAFYFAMDSNEDAFLLREAIVEAPKMAKRLSRRHRATTKSLSSRSLSPSLSKSEDEDEDQVASFLQPTDSDAVALDVSPRLRRVSTLPVSNDYHSSMGPSRTSFDVGTRSRNVSLHVMTASGPRVYHSDSDSGSQGESPMKISPHRKVEGFHTREERKAFIAACVEDSSEDSGNDEQKSEKSKSNMPNKHTGDNESSSTSTSRPRPPSSTSAHSSISKGSSKSRDVFPRDASSRSASTSGAANAGGHKRTSSSMRGKNGAGTPPVLLTRASSKTNRKSKNLRTSSVGRDANNHLLPEPKVSTTKNRRSLSTASDQSVSKFSTLSNHSPKHGPLAVPAFTNKLSPQKDKDIAGPKRKKSASKYAPSRLFNFRRGSANVDDIEVFSVDDANLIGKSGTPPPPQSQQSWKSRSKSARASGPASYLFAKSAPGTLSRNSLKLKDMKKNFFGNDENEDNAARRLRDKQEAKDDSSAYIRDDAKVVPSQSSNTRSRVDEVVQFSGGSGTTDRDIRDCIRAHVNQFQLNKFEILTSGSFRKRGRFMAGWRTRIYALVPPGYLFYFDNIRDLDGFRNIMLSRDLYKSSERREHLRKHILGSCPLVEPPQEIRLLPGSFKGAKQVLTIKIAAGEAHRRFYFSFPDKMAVQRLLSDIDRVRSWGDEYERRHPEVVAAAARAEDEDRREEAEERRRRAAAERAAATAAGYSSERGSGTIGRLRGFGVSSRISKSRSPKPLPFSSQGDDAAKPSATSALTAARGVSPRTEANDDGGKAKAERDAKAALINKFEHLRSATLTQKMLQRVQTRLATRTSEAKEAEQKTTGVVTPQPRYRTHEESEEAAMLVQLEKLSKEYASLTSLSRRRRTKQNTPPARERASGLASVSPRATRARAARVAEDVGVMSDSDDDQPTLKLNKNGKTVSIASDPVSQGLWTTLQTRRPSARKSIYFNTSEKGWNRDQLRADLRAFQKKNGDAAAPHGETQSMAASRVDSVLGYRPSLVPRPSIFGPRASMFGGHRRSIAFTPDAKKKTGLSSVRSHLEKTLHLREGQSLALVDEKSKLHISLDDHEQSISRSSYSNIVTTPLSPSRVSRMASMSVTSPRGLSRAMSFGEESLAEMTTPSVPTKVEMEDTVSPRGLVQGVVAGKEMPMIAMATGAFSEMAFSTVLDLMEPHVWRVAGFGLQDADVLDEGNTLRESDVYLVVEPVVNDAPAPGEDHFTPHIHQTFASRFEVYYWIGRSVSLEKPAIGAIKAVELAQVLSGRTKLHREVQGEESDGFLALFRGDFDVSPGGSKSALRVVKSQRDTFVKSLMRVHGDKKGVTVEHVALAKKSLSSKNSFLLDTYDTIFVYFRTESNWHERCKALQLAHRLKDCRTTGHSPTAFVAVLNENRAEVLPDNTPDVRSERRFKALLSGKVKKHSGSKNENEKKVYDVFVDNDGEVNADVLDDVDCAKLSKNMLRKDRILVFDFGSQMFVWCGSESIGEDWPAARELARRLLDKRPKWTHFAFMSEHCETPLFADKFFDWFDVRRPVVPAKPFRRFEKSSPLDSIDFKALHDAYPPSPPPDADTEATAATGEDQADKEAKKDGDEASTVATAPVAKARSVAETRRDGVLSLRPLTEAFESIPTMSNADAKHKSLHEIALEEEGNEELEVDTDQLLVFQMNENELDEVSTDGFFDSDKAYIVVHLYRLLSEESDDDISDAEDDKEDAKPEADGDSDSDFDFGDNTIVPSESDDSGDEVDTASASPATPTTSGQHDDDEESDAEDEDDALNIRYSSLSTHRRRLVSMFSPRELRKQQKQLRSATEPLARLNYVQRVLSERLRASVYFWKGSDCSYARFYAWKCEVQAEVSSYFLNTSPRFEVIHQGREPERMLRLFDEGIVVFKGDSPELPEPRLPCMHAAADATQKSGSDATQKSESDADRKERESGEKGPPESADENDTANADPSNADEKEKAPATDNQRAESRTDDGKPSAESTEEKASSSSEKGAKGDKKPLVSDFSDHFCQLFQVHGFDHRSVSAVQVECVAENLNSADVFVLITPKIAFCWCGKYSNDAVNGQSIGILDKLVGDREIRLVQERQEQKDFWIWFKEAKTEYGAAPNGQTFSRSPRLFACSSHTSRFSVKERHVVSQRELDTTRVMVLDAFSTVFVWCGKESPEADCELAKSFASRYIELSPSHASSCSVITVAEGGESPLFKSYFHGWNNWLQPEFVDPYAPTTKAFEDAGVFGKVVDHKIQPHLKAQINELKKQRASRLNSKLKQLKNRTLNGTLNSRKKKRSKRTKLRGEKTFKNSSTLFVAGAPSSASPGMHEENDTLERSSSFTETGAHASLPEAEQKVTAQSSASSSSPAEASKIDTPPPPSPEPEPEQKDNTPCPTPSASELPATQNTSSMSSGADEPLVEHSQNEQEIVVSDLPPVPSPPRSQVPSQATAEPIAIADSDSESESSGMEYDSPTSSEKEEEEEHEQGDESAYYAV